MDIGLELARKRGFRWVNLASVCPRYAVLKLVVLLLLVSFDVSASGVLVQNQKVSAKDVNLFVGNSVPRKEFSYSSGAAWLDENGSFRMKTDVKHNKLLCAVYQTSIRFGSGERGCAGVQWLDEPYRLVAKKHCNGAELTHVGGNVLPLLAQSYSSVSCAQIQVVCMDGACR